MYRRIFRPRLQTHGIASDHVGKRGCELQEEAERLQQLEDGPALQRRQERQRRMLLGFLVVLLLVVLIGCVSYFFVH